MNCTTKLIVVICALFGVGLVVFVYVSDKIEESQENSTTSEEEETSQSNGEGPVFCTDEGCGVVSYQKQSHVHVRGSILWCPNGTQSTAYHMIKKMEMWDDDNFLHGADDYMGECDIDTASSFNCHYIGPALIEGSSYTNPPDVYFKFYLTDETCGSGNLGCYVATIGHVITPDYHKGRDCDVPSSLGAAVREADHLLTLEPFPYYHELDATWSWIVWKCYAALQMDPIALEFCHSENE